MSVDLLHSRRKVIESAERQYLGWCVSLRMVVTPFNQRCLCAIAFVDCIKLFEWPPSVSFPSPFHSHSPTKPTCLTSSSPSSALVLCFFQPS